MRYRGFFLFFFLLLVLGSCDAARGTRTPETPASVSGHAQRAIWPPNGSTHAYFVYWQARCEQPNGWHPTRENPQRLNEQLPYNAVCGYTSPSGTGEVTVLVVSADKPGFMRVEKTPLETRIREFLPSELEKPKIFVGAVRIDHRDTEYENAWLSWRADANEYVPAVNGDVIVRRHFRDFLIVFIYRHTGDTKADEIDLPAFVRNVEIF